VSWIWSVLSFSLLLIVIASLWWLRKIPLLNRNSSAQLEHVKSELDEGLLWDTVNLRWQKEEPSQSITHDRHVNGYSSYDKSHHAKGAPKQSEAVDGVKEWFAHSELGYLQWQSYWQEEGPPYPWIDRLEHCCWGLLRCGDVLLKWILISFSLDLFILCLRDRSLLVRRLFGYRWRWFEHSLKHLLLILFVPEFFAFDILEGL